MTKNKQYLLCIVTSEHENTREAEIQYLIYLILLPSVDSFRV